MLPLFHSQSLVPARRPRSQVLCHFRSFSVLVYFISSLSLDQISFVVIKKRGVSYKRRNQCVPPPQLLLLHLVKSETKLLILFNQEAVGHQVRRVGRVVV